MRLRHGRLAGLAVSLATLASTVLVAGSPLASAGATAAAPGALAGAQARAATAQPAGAQASAAAVQPAAGASRPVLLINGDQVLTSAAPGGPPVGGAEDMAAASVAGSLLTLSEAGQVYEIPAAAVPYLGHGLDWSLFDLTSLLRMETDGRLPVRIGYQGPLPAVPGVTITRSGAGTARGYLTAASARKFGAALDRQYLAEHSGGSFGSRGLFAGGLSISLTGPAAPPARPP